MTREELEGFHCAVEAAIAILGGKYKAIIVWWLTESGTMRYSDIKRKIPQATAKMLTQQLKELEAKDGIRRTVTLDRQFRTHPVLGRFCSRLFYEPHNERYDSPRGAGDFAHSLPGIENKAAVWVDIPARLGEPFRRAQRRRQEEIVHVDDGRAP